MKQKLIEEACEVRKKAYCPYSNFAVGAALLTSSGKIFTGVNIENIAYPSGICAERSAISCAVSAGERDFVSIAISSKTGVSPCGFCRQVLYEFNPKLHVILVDREGNITAETTLEELLPMGVTSLS